MLLGKRKGDDHIRRLRCVDRIGHNRVHESPKSTPLVYKSGVSRIYARIVRNCSSHGPNKCCEWQAKFGSRSLSSDILVGRIPRTIGDHTCHTVLQPIQLPGRIDPIVPRFDIRSNRNQSIRRRQRRRNAFTVPATDLTSTSASQRNADAQMMIRAFDRMVAS